MIRLPDFKKTFDFENDFYLSCQNSRIGKSIAHYELYKMSSTVPGTIVECGVFKGISLTRFAAFREIFGQERKKKIVGFDTFGKFPTTNFSHDQKMLTTFINDAGDQSISVAQLKKVLQHKKISNVDLIAGDINATVPAYVKADPKLKISLLNLDTDIYEPAVTILKYLYPCLVPGGVLILDDYGIFPGETKAVDDYFKGKKVTIQKFSYTKTPRYIIKQ